MPRPGCAVLLARIRQDEGQALAHMVLGLVLHGTHPITRQHQLVLVAPVAQGAYPVGHLALGQGVLGSDRCPRDHHDLCRPIQNPHMAAPVRKRSILSSGFIKMKVKALGSRSEKRKACEEYLVRMEEQREEQKRSRGKVEDTDDTIRWLKTELDSLKD